MTFNVAETIGDSLVSLMVLSENSLGFYINFVGLSKSTDVR